MSILVIIVESNSSCDIFDVSLIKNFVKFKIVKWINIFYYHFLKFKPIIFLDFSLCTTKDNGRILMIKIALAMIFIKKAIGCHNHFLC